MRDTGQSKSIRWSMFNPRTLRTTVKYLLVNNTIILLEIPHAIFP